MANQRIRKYAWEVPVRLTHWVNFLCIVTFIATGLYIGNPYSHAISANSYIMGWMRYLHFVAGYVFLCSLALRIYWAFMGNKFASWRVWFPVGEKRMEDMKDALKFYTFLSRKPPYAVGHTAVAGLVYLVMFLVFLFQLSSGFAMLSLSSKGVLPAVLGGWLLSMMDLQTIRLFHHMAIYVIVSFVFVHLYIAWWLDTVERNGLLDSIFSGYKFVSGKEWE